MPRSPKPRSDSRLKTLPDDAQAEIMLWLRGNSREQVVKLASDKYGVKTNPCSLTEFRDWYSTSKRLQECASWAKRMEAALMEKPELRLTPQQIADLGQNLFEQRAIMEDDSKLFIAIQKAKADKANADMARENLALARSKWEFDVAKEVLKRFDSIKPIVRDNATTEEEKLRRIREEMFGQLPEAA